MGICFEKPLIERQLTQELRRDKLIDKMNKKVLILGPRHSGKSTIFNQLKYIHGNGFSNDERIDAMQHIIEFIIESMQHIINCIEEYDKYKQFPITKFTLNNEAKLSAEFIKTLSIQQNKLTELIIYHIELLWKQKAIKRIVKYASKYYIDDSCQYFLQNISKFKCWDYMPSDQDIIQLRIKCDGFNETSIQMGTDIVHVYDINYKQYTYKFNKIMSCFENVNAILFVASLSCFDEVIFEDEKSFQQKLEWKHSLCSVEKLVGDDILNVILSFVGYPENGMHNALDVFNELYNNEWFKRIPVILLLTKSDLFRSKMDKIEKEIKENGNDNDELNAFNVCFPKYKKKVTYKKCSKYIVKQFEKRNKKKTTLYKHLVNGTDTTLMRVIFRDVQNIVIATCLDEAGLL
eukprot:523926_1